MCGMKSLEADDNLWLDYLQEDVNVLYLGKKCHWMHSDSILRLSFPQIINLMKACIVLTLVYFWTGTITK